MAGDHPNPLRSNQFEGFAAMGANADTDNATTTGEGQGQATEAHGIQGEASHHAERVDGERISGDTIHGQDVGRVNGQGATGEGINGQDVNAQVAHAQITDGQLQPGKTSGSGSVSSDVMFLSLWDIQDTNIFADHRRSSCPRTRSLR
jgi:hypothetical protein